MVIALFALPSSAMCVRGAGSFECCHAGWFQEFGEGFLLALILQINGVVCCSSMHLTAFRELGLHLAAVTAVVVLTWRPLADRKLFQFPGSNQSSHLAPSAIPMLTMLVQGKDDRLEPHPCAVDYYLSSARPAV